MQIQQQSNQDWSSESEDNVVMRTVSFGRGHVNGLEVCARRDNYVVSKEGRIETMRGFREDVIVPLGLIAATKVQMRLEGRMLVDCWGRSK